MTGINYHSARLYSVSLGLRDCQLPSDIAVKLFYAFTGKGFTDGVSDLYGTAWKLPSVIAVDLTELKQAEIISENDSMSAEPRPIFKTH